MYITQEDIKRNNELCIGETFGYLLARSAGIQRPPFPLISPTVTGGKENAFSALTKNGEIEANAWGKELDAFASQHLQYT